MTTYDALIATVRDDQRQSNLRWEAAIESDEREGREGRWAEDAEACDTAYDDALEALEAGDLAAAERALELANMAESRGGDNCDAHHALAAVRAEIAEPTVRCECGSVYGERCQWTGPKAETVVVEVMPAHLRASHDAAGNSGSYPHNGAERIRVEQSCADRLVETEDGWATILS